MGLLFLCSYALSFGIVVASISNNRLGATFAEVNATGIISCKPFCHQQNVQLQQSVMAENSLYVGICRRYDLRDVCLDLLPGQHNV